MRYECRLTAYDIFDNIHAHVRVWDSTIDPSQEEHQVLKQSVSIAGQGDSTQEAWLRRVLLGLLSELPERPTA